MKFSGMVTVENPHSPVSEAFRTMRTNIQYSFVDKLSKIVVITSAGPGEGKTTTSCNLAALLAQDGHKTIIIDCDLRKPQLHNIYGLSNEIGLSNLIVEEVTTEQAIHKTSLENFYVLTSGRKPPNPAELLGTERMKCIIDQLRNEYEYIIIDSPPVMLVTDAQILSQYSDGFLLVAAAREVHKDALIKSKELLLKVNGKIIGVVLNKVDTPKAGKYYKYSRYYDKTNEKGRRKRRKEKPDSINLS